MKLHSLFLALFFSVFSLSSYANTQTDTIKIAKSKRDKASTIITGTIIKAIDKDDFILQDSTGEILIEVDLLTEQERVAFFKKYPNLIGAVVAIEGILDKEILETTKVDVKRIEVISVGKFDPFMMALNDDFSQVQSIRTAKSLSHKSQVLLHGVVIQLLDDDEFILRDNQNNDIKVELDFHSKGEEIAFRNQYGTNLVGSTVLVQGFLDKEFMEKVKVDANRIQIITRSATDPFADVVNKAKSANR